MTSKALLRRVGVLGGTFDPMHNGHLALAKHFAKMLELTELILLPAGQPWQKTDVSLAEHRLAMTRAAASSLILPGVIVTVAADEITHQGPTYTVETLKRWRAHEAKQGITRASLSLIIGADQLTHLHSWREWPRLFDFAHVCAVTRPGFELSLVAPAVTAALTIRKADAATLKTTVHGHLLIDTTLALNISATAIRKYLHAYLTEYTFSKQLSATTTFVNLMPTEVWNYVLQQHLY